MVFRQKSTGRCFSTDNEESIAIFSDSDAYEIVNGEAEKASTVASAPKKTSTRKKASEDTSNS